MQFISAPLLYACHTHIHTYIHMHIYVATKIIYEFTSQYTHTYMQLYIYVYACVCMCWKQFITNWMQFNIYLLILQIFKYNFWRKLLFAFVFSFLILHANSEEFILSIKLSIVHCPGVCMFVRLYAGCACVCVTVCVYVLLLIDVFVNCSTFSILFANMGS